MGKGSGMSDEQNTQVQSQTDSKALSQETSKALNKLRSTALAWLGRQEYYEAKFRQKLKDKEATEEQIELIVGEFIENNWLSELRYCEAFVRSRIAKGQGKIRIQADARQKRLDQDYLIQAFDNIETDWFEQALQTYNRRYGDKPLDNSDDGFEQTQEKRLARAKEKAKRMRFMQSRGFNQEQTQFAMAPNNE